MDTSPPKFSDSLAQRIPELRSEFERNRWVQIFDWLDPRWVRAVYAGMSETHDWHARICDKSLGPRVVSHEEIQKLGFSSVEEYARKGTESLNKLAGGGTMAYLFFCKSLEDFVSGSWHSPWKENLLTFLRNDFLQLIRDITGKDLCYLEEPQATMYSPGCFLGQHGDGVGARKVAFIANFTDCWQPDFGGCLTVHVQSYWRIVEPTAGSLVLMNVDDGGYAHYVSHVAPWAPRNRYAITGWAAKP